MDHRTRAKDRHTRAKIIHLTCGEGGELGENLITLALNLPRSRCDQTVVGALPRQMRDELARHAVRWVNVGATAPGTANDQAPTARQLERLIAASEATVLHAHGMQAGILASQVIRDLSPRPATVLSTCGFAAPPPRRGLLGPVRDRAFRKAIAGFDRILVESEAELARLQAYEPRAAGRAAVLRPFVDTNRYSHKIDAGAKRRKVGLLGEAALVGFAGPLVERHGLETLLRAAGVIIADLPNVEFLLIGDGPLQDSLQALAHSLRISGSVVFLKDRADVPEVIAAMNVLVAPSPGEGGMLRALQALSLQIPIVAVGGATTSEYLGSLEEVVVVPPGDPEAMAEGIRQQLEVLPPADVPPGAVSEMGLPLSHDDFLVSREEYDLDRTGLKRRLRAFGEVDAAEQALERHDVRHAAERVAEFYEELVH
jgi:glycosyltransferase involved in cell wall biosynthesis